MSECPHATGSRISVKYIILHIYIKNYWMFLCFISVIQRQSLKKNQTLNISQFSHNDIFKDQVLLFLSLMTASSLSPYLKQ